MFRHILVPTDSSKLAAKAGVRLARSLGARVTGVYVIPPYKPPVYGEAALYYVSGMSREDNKKRRTAGAHKARARRVGS